jgi:glycerophosphoryl diester phosphodiesterase
MKRFGYLFLIFVFSNSSCKKGEFEISNLNGNKIGILGHGGMGISSTYPMNSVESILNCMHLNSDGTEIDVQMTNDGVLVAFHDESFENRTNISGKLFQMNWEEIDGAQYTAPTMHGYKVVTLRTIFSALHSESKLQGKRFPLDCKNFNGDISFSEIEQYCSSLYALIDEFDLADEVILELQNDVFIDKIHSERPDLSIFVFQPVEQALNKAISSQLEGIVSSIDNITQEQINLAHANNVMVTLFNTQSNQRNIDAIKMNPDFIETDRLEHLISVLK